MSDPQSEAGLLLPGLPRFETVVPEGQELEKKRQARRQATEGRREVYS
jgi:hypothetical protein